LTAVIGCRLAAMAAADGTYLAYMYVATMTRDEPITNCSDSSKSKKYIDAMHEMTIAADVAKPLRMLSAYLTTTATSSPLNAWREIINHTTES